MQSAQKQGLNSLNIPTREQSTQKQKVTQQTLTLKQEQGIIKRENDMIWDQQLNDNNDELLINTQQLDNYVFCFGKNKDGELSYGQNKMINKPKHPKGIKKMVLKYISSGSQHTAVVTKSGQLMITGSALHGKLGIQDLTVTNLRTFTVIPSFKDLKTKQVACGDYHTLCLLETGEVYAFGGTLHKKLGQRIGKAAPVQSLLKYKIIKVDCGDFHSAALSDNGQLFTWGGGGNYFNKGQLGHGHRKDVENPEQVCGDIQTKFIVDISCGGFHTMALTDQGELYSWGAGTYGECGYGEYIDSFSPRKVNITFNQQNFIADEPSFYTQNDKCKIIKISCGGHHSLILTNKGYLYSCGYGYHGQLGLKSTDNQKEPVLVFSLTNKKIINVCAGWNHSLALTEKGDLYASGYGSSGQLGLGDEESKISFTFVMSLGGLNISGIYAGGNHSWVTIDDGQPYLDDYSPPSPLKICETNISFPSQQDKFQTTHKSRDVSPDISLLQQQKLEPQTFERMLQVIYSELDMCHRFIRFTINQQKENQFKEVLDEYIKELYNVETGIVYTRLQNDSELFDASDKQINVQNQNNIQRSHTLMIIFDPSKNLNQENIENQINQNKENIVFGKVPLKSCSIGDMYMVKESEVMQDPQEKLLGTWFLLFNKLFNKLVDKVKFFELRPQNLINN